MCNSDKIKRLNDAYRYLYGVGLVKNKTDFSNKIGYGRANTSSALNGDKRYLTDSFLGHISSRFGQINLNWLLTGEGDMLNDQTLDDNTNTSVKALTDENSLKFYYELSATASNIDGLTDNEINQPFQRIYIPGYEGCVGFKTTGESMLPTLKHGDIIVVERKTAETIVNGEIYLVVTRDGQRMIKRLVQQDIDDDGIGHITCVSDNPNKEIYRSFEITTDMIHTISRVKGYVFYSDL